MIPFHGKLLPKMSLEAPLLTCLSINFHAPFLLPFAQDEIEAESERLLDEREAELRRRLQGFEDGTTK